MFGWVQVCSERAPKCVCQLLEASEKCTVMSLPDIDPNRDAAATPEAPSTMHLTYILMQALSTSDYQAMCLSAQLLYLL